MKKIWNIALAAMMAVSFTACGTDTSSETGTDTADTPVSSEGAASAGAESVSLNVTTTFAGEDGNAQNFKNAVKAWESETGNKVVDTSATSDENFKTRVVTDFETGSEPDVLFFFNGADANDFVKAGKVVSIDEIRAEYPEYASNMDDGRIAASPAGGVKYAVPVNGYWEALFANTEVLDAAGVALPDENTSWEDFLDICQKVKDAGYTPVAAALGNIPHYWWEFGIFNHQTPENHLDIPASSEDELGQEWVAGLEDIKTMYELGYFPDNTLSATDDETFAMFTDGKAAFLLDGSWKVGGIVSACQSDPEDASTLDTAKLDHFDVTYFPGQDARKTTDLIGGLSMGYYITRKAWEDPATREAAVSFVEYMTSDEIVPLFAQHTATALNNAPEVDESQFNSLQIKAIRMMSKVTSFTGAVQDSFSGECRTSTFDGMPELVTGKKDIAEAVQEGLDTYYATQG
ncbi:MAG: extracellular solute-binding protein [Solobacterium sp.]|nr:extracellular solute-binding protein [Solobacterium sp.]